jgi:hypothetical protein
LILFCSYSLLLLLVLYSWIFYLDLPIPGSLSLVLYSWLFSLDPYSWLPLWFSIPDLFLVLAPSFCFAPNWPLIKELGLQIKLSWNFYTIYRGLEPSRNRVIIPARKAT